MGRASYSGREARALLLAKRWTGSGSRTALFETDYAGFVDEEMADSSGALRDGIGRDGVALDPARSVRGAGNVRKT